VDPRVEPAGDHEERGSLFFDGRYGALTPSLESLSLPGTLGPDPRARQSTLEPALALRVDARIIPGFQTGHGTPNDDPGTGHDQRGYVPLASLH
jgi:hypothetical protein